MKNNWGKVLIVFLVFALGITLFYLLQQNKQRSKVDTDLKTLIISGVNDTYGELDNFLQTQTSIKNIPISLFQYIENVSTSGRILIINSKLSDQELNTLNSLLKTFNHLERFLSQVNYDEIPFELNTCDGIIIGSEEEIIQELYKYSRVLNVLKGDLDATEERWLDIMENWKEDNISRCDLR